VHSLGGKGKRHSDSSEETFGHISDNDTNSEHKVGNGIVSIDETKDKESDTEEESDTRDDLDESFNFNGKRSLSRFGSLGKVSDQTNDGVVTSSEDDTSTLTSGALGTEEADILGLENVGVSLVWETEKLFGFTSKRRVVNLHLGGLEKDGVSGNVVTTFDDDQVTNDEVLGRDGLLLAVTDDSCGSGDEVVEFVHQGSGLGGLLVREATSNESDSSQHNTEIQVGLIVVVGVLLGLDTVTNETKEGTEPKKKGEETSHFFKEHTVPGKSFLLSEGVLTLFGKDGGSLSSGKTVLGVSLQLFAQFLSGPHVVFPLTDLLGGSNSVVHVASTTKALFSQVIELGHSELLIAFKLLKELFVENYG
jgi:hypothetical protein